jgi:hypothetical protein
MHIVTDPYEVLGLKAGATDDEVRAAYRRLVKTAHPDASGSAVLFRMVQDAYETLTDPTRRAEYNLHARRATPPPSSAGPSRQTRPPTNSSSSSRDRSAPPPGATRTAPPRDDLPPRRTRATIVGSPAAFSNSGAAQAGFEGEKAAAIQLAAVDLPDSAWVFYDVVPDGGAGNVDTVIVAGDQMLLIDAKRWSPGRYTHDGTGCYRDGARFQPGDATSAAFLTEKLVTDLGWTGNWHRLLAVSSANGRDADLDLSGYANPHMQAVTVETLAHYVTSWAALPGARTKITDPETIIRLHNRTTLNEGTILADDTAIVPPVPDGAFAATKARSSNQAARLAVIVAAAAALVATAGQMLLGGQATGPVLGVAGLIGGLAAAVSLLGGVDSRATTMLQQAQRSVGIAVAPAPAFMLGLQDRAAAVQMYAAGAAALAGLAAASTNELLQPLGAAVPLALQVLVVCCLITATTSRPRRQDSGWHGVFAAAADRDVPSALLAHSIRFHSQSADASAMRDAAPAGRDWDAYLAYVGLPRSGSHSQA